jgi:serine/threonine protein kinase
VLVYSTKDVSEREDTKLDDFEVGNLLGKGAFGRVYRAVHKASGTTYALKSLNKRMLVAAKQVSGALTEKQVLTENRTHPCIVRLHWAFQDDTSLYRHGAANPHGQAPHVLWNELRSRLPMRCGTSCDRPRVLPGT